MASFDMWPINLGSLAILLFKFQAQYKLEQFNLIALEMDVPSPSKQIPLRNQSPE